MNKRGGDKLISVYWFAILFIVAAGVVYMAVLFYGEPFDVREIEANALTDRVADCLVRGGELVEGWENKNLESCGITFEVEDTEGWENDQFYLKVEYSKFSENNFIVLIDEGNSLLKEEYKGGDNFPVCVERSFYAVDEAGGQYEIKVLSVVRKTEKNVL